MHDGTSEVTVDRRDLEMRDAGAEMGAQVVRRGPLQVASTSRRVLVALDARGTLVRLMLAGACGGGVAGVVYWVLEFNPTIAFLVGLVGAYCVQRVAKKNAHEVALDQLHDVLDRGEGLRRLDQSIWRKVVRAGLLSEDDIAGFELRAFAEGQRLPRIEARRRSLRKRSDGIFLTRWLNAEMTTWPTKFGFEVSRLASTLLLVAAPVPALLAAGSAVGLHGTWAKFPELGKPDPHTYVFIAAATLALFIASHRLSRRADAVEARQFARRQGAEDSGYRYSRFTSH